MALKKSPKQGKIVPFDSKKESLFKELSSLLQKFGYAVRREKLKQGHGWKAMSGACRSGESKIIFIDRRMAQSEQVTFLVGKIVLLESSLLAQEMCSISEEARNIITAMQIQEKDQLLAS